VEQLEVRRELARGARPGTNFFVLIVLACVMAATGLLMNSPAVVIGAMLVAPLMSPIQAFSLGLVLGDLRLIRFSTEAIFKGIVLAILISAFIGLLSPLKVITDEMLAQSRPTLLDLLVALAAGTAGAYAMARKDVSAALPGVAVAASLTPPLAVIGLSLSMGDVQVAGGAMLLFATNIAAISLAGGIVFLLVGFRPQARDPASRRRLGRRLTASLLLLLAIALPLGAMMARTAGDTAQEQAVRLALNQHLAATARLVDLEVEREGASLIVVATVRGTEAMAQEAVDEMAQAMSEQLGGAVELELCFLPAVRSVSTDH
jgi:uncharacterized hydrophobic protein (TIGR00271 family)